MDTMPISRLALRPKAFSCLSIRTQPISGSVQARRSARRQAALVVEVSVSNPSAQLVHSALTLHQSTRTCPPRISTLIATLPHKGVSAAYHQAATMSKIRWKFQAPKFQGCNLVLITIHRPIVRESIVVSPDTWLAYSHLHCICHAHVQASPPQVLISLTFDSRQLRNRLRRTRSRLQWWQERALCELAGAHA